MAKSTLRHHLQLRLQRCQALLQTHGITCKALMLQELLVLLVTWVRQINDRLMVICWLLAK